MALVNANAAGIDVGDTLHAVAVPEGRDEMRVKTFGAMTRDVEQITNWLKQCKVNTVAMENTGIYWKPQCINWYPSTDTGHPKPG